MQFDRDQVTGSDPRPPLRPNRTLTALAEQVARLARPLLPSRHMFVGIEADAGGELCISWWGLDYCQIARITAAPEGFCSADTAEGRLQDAAVALLRYLACRWPVPPQRLGAITDGSGIAFSPDHPALSEPGWLLRHAAGRGELVAILPLDPAGPCALLDARAEAGPIH